MQTQITVFTRLLGHGVTPEPEAAEVIPPPPPATNQMARVAGKVASVNVACESLENAVLVLLLHHENSPNHVLFPRKRASDLAAR